MLAGTQLSLGSALVAERDPDFYIAIGPNGELELDDAMSPISLRLASRAGTGAKKAPEAGDEGDDADEDEEA